MELNKLHNEDCVLTMAKMPDNFIDCIICVHKSIIFASWINIFAPLVKKSLQKKFIEKFRRFIALKSVHILAEVLAQQKELLRNHIAAREKLKGFARFVNQNLFILNHLKNIAQENVLKLHTKKICREIKTLHT